MWYHPKSIRNILSLSTINKKNYNIYDSENGEKIIVIITRSGGHNMIFTSNKDILYYNDMNNTEGVSMLSTMEENRNHYTQRQYERAKFSR